jgi:glutamate/tyrosine decarboxylase-like PLP-dependent enzyme
MDVKALRAQIEQDKKRGGIPLLVAGTAGSVSTGAIDPLPEIAAICRDHGVWFHVDGAYGAVAAILPDASPDLKGLSEADSVAVDPHKWLYAPLEAGCALVRDPEILHATFSYHPAYYHQPEFVDEPPIHYHEHGMQNSRGFRALKVWLALRQVGLDGYRQMIADDIRLSEELSRLVGADPALEGATQGLSITTFRYVPPDLDRTDPQSESYLNRLNEELLNRLQSGGEAFFSNAVVGGRFLLRACIVNFRTSLEDVRALPGIVTRSGALVDEELKRSRTAAPRRQPSRPPSTA